MAKKTIPPAYETVSATLVGNARLAVVCSASRVGKNRFLHLTAWCRKPTVENVKILFDLVHGIFRKNNNAGTTQ